MSYNEVKLPPPPQSKEHERSILSSIISDPDVTMPKIDFITADDFYLQHHKMIYSAALSLHMDNIPIDLLSIGDKLDSLEQLNLCGGRAYLAELSTSATTSANVSLIAKKLKDVTKKRALYNLGIEIIKSVNKKSKKSDEISEMIIHSIMDCPEDESSGSKEALSVHVNKWMVSDGKIQNPTGYYQLDNNLYGWQEGMMYLIAGEPNVGKSAFVQNLVLSSLKANPKLACVYFTYDDDVGPCLARLITANCDGICGTHEVTTLGSQPDKIKKHIIMKVDDIYKMSDTRLHMYGNSHQSTMSILAAIKKHKMNHDGPMMVVIDSAQHVKPSGPSNTTRDVHMAIANEVHKITKTENVITLVTSELRKPDLSRVWRRPTPDDIIETKKWHYNAALVGIYYQKPDEVLGENGADARVWVQNRLYIAKNKTGDFKDRDLLFQFQPATCQIKEHSFIPMSKAVSMDEDFA